MQRIRRWTLNALTVLSLVLCVATVGLWVRSYWRHDSAAIEYQPRRAFLRVQSEGGVFCLLGYRTYGLPFDGPRFRSTRSSSRANGPLYVPTPAYLATRAGATLRGRGRFVLYTETYGHPLTPTEVDADRATSAALWRERAEADRVGRSNSEAAIDAGTRLSLRLSNGRGYYTWRLYFPLWFAVLLTFPLPAYRCCRAWIDRRRPGHCLNCDYNLTGNVSGVCPECGKAIVRAG